MKVEQKIRQLNYFPLTMLNRNCCKQGYWHTNRQTNVFDLKTYRLLWSIFVQNLKAIRQTLFELLCHNEFSGTDRSDLFVCGLSSHSRMFHSYEDVTIAGEVLQILTYARYSRPLSIEGSSACHTYCVTGHPFIMVISEEPWHSHLLPSVKQ